MLRVSLSLLFLIYSNTLLSYSNFIGYGYTSCLTCHYNALGDGPLTDYGRAVSATMVASRSFYPDDITDQELGDSSGFFFGALPNMKFIKPSLSARELRYTKDVFSSKSVTQNILMQADANLIIRPISLFSKNNIDKLIFSITYGYVPLPSKFKTSKTKPATAEKTIISREQYASYTFNKTNRVYVGLMSKAYGLRIPEHIAFSRTVTGLAQNDQSHGITYYYGPNEYFLAANYFVGNMSQDSPLRQKGFSLTGEYELAPRVRVGASFLDSKNNYLKNTLYSVQFRMGSNEGGSIITELGKVAKKPLAPEIVSTDAIYNFTQFMLKVDRGLHWLNSFEFYKADVNTTTSTTYRYTTGLQYFPIQRIEVKLDLMNTKIIAPTSVTPDAWDLLAQAHLWF